MVTGATGFLGGAIARQLVADGVSVVGLGRNEAKGRALQEGGVEFKNCELSEVKQLRSAFEGVDTVIHSAALSSPWGRRRAFISANVDGTRNVLDACADNSIGRLVHISSPSVYFSHEDGRDVTEDRPYADPPSNHYAESKILAEKLVHGRPDISTITIRPRAIFGPGDTTILPRIIDSLQRKKLPIIGDGENEANLTFIDNAVAGTILAATADDSFSGRVYNLTDGEAVKLWAIIEEVCELLDLPKPARRISINTAFRAAGVIEWIHRWLLFGAEPRLTRYSVTVVARTQTLSIDAARRDLGYAPEISTAEGLRRFVAWWKSGNASS